MLEAISSVIPTVFSWFGQFFSALTTTDGALYVLMPLVGIAVVITLVRFGFGLIRNVLWGA